MASIAERAVKLERRLAERERRIEIVIPPWLADVTPPASEPEAAQPSSTPAPEPRCDECGYVLPRRARYCSGCGVAVAGPSR